jgi:hypothetical protein
LACPCAGNGWGDRFKLSVLNGCIPWVLQDDMEMDWETVLPLREFSVRMPQHMIWRLPQLVDMMINEEPELVREPTPLPEGTFFLLAILASNQRPAFSLCRRCAKRVPGLCVPGLCISCAHSCFWKDAFGICRALRSSMPRLHTALIPSLVWKPTSVALAVLMCGESKAWQGHRCSAAVPVTQGCWVRFVAQIRSMQEKMRCAWRFWVWDPPHGLAMDALMCQLRMKLVPSIKPRVDFEACKLHCT